MPFGPPELSWERHIFTRPSFGRERTRLSLKKPFSRSGTNRGARLTKALFSNYVEGIPSANPPLLHRLIVTCKTVQSSAKSAFTPMSAFDPLRTLAMASHVIGSPPKD